MKWPSHRTSINRTLAIAKRDPAVQTVITVGLKEGKGTVTILQDVIAQLESEKDQMLELLKEWQELGGEIQKERTNA